MARLSEEDVQEIIEVVEEQLYSVPQLNKIEKMRMKQKSGTKPVGLQRS